MSAVCQKQRIFFHRYRFSGQGRFLHLQIGASGQPYIRRYLCPCLQVYQIARHQFRRRNLLTDTFPDHNGLWTGQLFQCFQCLSGFSLLQHAHQGIDHYHSADDHGITELPQKDGYHSCDQ